MTDWLQKR